MDGDRLPSALESGSQIRGLIDGRKLGFFLDFDGTLAPIGLRPDLVVLPPRAKQVLQRLNRSHLVCILSGRGLEDLKTRTGLPGLFYAGDHGYRIEGPPGSGVAHEVGTAARGALAAAAVDLRDSLSRVAGVVIEAKGLSLSVHYRLVPPAAVSTVAETVHEVGDRYPSLRQSSGKLIFEFHPGEVWDKGRAMTWLIDRLGYGRHDICPICLGDDLTDEDTFLAAQSWGISIAVDPHHGPTCADYKLRDTDEATDFLAAFAQPG